MQPTYTFNPEFSPSWSRAALAGLVASGTSDDRGSRVWGLGVGCSGVYLDPLKGGRV